MVTMMDELLTGARLSVGKHHRIIALKQGFHQGLRRELIDQFVLARLVKCVVEAKLLVVDVFRQIEFHLRHVNDNNILRRYG